MPEKDLISLIRDGINKEYLYVDLVLFEERENMNVPLSPKDSEIVLIHPKDDERDGLWSCFSDHVDRQIADFIAFKDINNEIVGFIFELKKSKTDNNVKKASDQIISTYPLLRMIYEKTTGQNACDLKTIGIRIFGVGGKSVQKIPRADKIKIPDELEREYLAIGNFIQNRNDNQLCSLEYFFNEVKHLFEKS